ncbi:hypothetical protein ACFOY2_21875 [Nonomuraea purpurea]|uniref:Uncharacterized protein n=1 Tax=Nonomuraea purpurea TaxID=1849276 RepID=A0ABV8GAL8_9ACTN
MDLTTAYTDAWYRQPDPVERVGDRRPTNEHWVMIAAVWLLAMWSSQQVPGWASILVPGRTKSREDRQWPEPPPLPELADAGDLPAITGATVLTSRVSTGPGQPYRTARADEEVAAELATLISDVVAVHEQREVALVRFLAGHLAGPYSDVLRLTTGAESPNGVSSPESLHLLHRDTRGSALRVSLTPALEIQRPPVFASDGPDGPLRTRIACVMTLLSDLLWVNNNNPVDFRFRIGRLDQDESDRVAEAARWWAENREDADEYDEEEFRAISTTDLRIGFRNVARLFLEELWDGENGIDEVPQLPINHLVSFLCDDLLDLVLARMSDNAQIVCSGFLPVTWPPEGEDEQTTVLLIAGHEVAVLAVDLTC